MIVQIYTIKNVFKYERGYYAHKVYRRKMHQLVQCKLELVLF